MNSSRASERRETLSAMILPTVKRSLQEEATKQDRSMGYIIERAIVEYLNRQGEKGPTP